MFWGLIMEPERRYTQQVKKSFHVSMAALDVSTSSDQLAQVMCSYEGRNYLLCTLKKPDLLQCPLDLSFDAGTEVSFAANGKCHVHLTGYLMEEFDNVEEEDEIEEEEQELEIKSKKRPKNIENGPPSKKPKVNITVSSSQNQEEEEVDDDSDDSEVGLETLLNQSADENDEDDETFNMDDGEEEEGEEEESDDEDDGGDIEEEESALSDDESGDEEEEQKVAAKPKTNGVLEKRETKKEKKQQEQQQVNNKQQQTKEKQVKTPKKEQLSPRKATLQGGIIIEEIKEGNGAPAKNGKFVRVFYEGRLKQNNKMFDSTKQGPGFKFRLGSGEVIKGWDVGVAGMKEGGKRRITCPPAMAYGPKGSPPAIPPNSTLIFEVELKKVG